MSNTSTVIIPELLTLKEAAALCSVSDRTLWTWATSGISPAPIRLGKGTVRYSRPEYLAWIAAGCKPIDALTPALSQGERGEAAHHA